MDSSRLTELAFEGDRPALARLLRVVEDRRDGWEPILSVAWGVVTKAHLVGITGSPGSGKSTLVNGLISVWRAVDRRVGVVAVDPSSPFSGGALLGDRIRMQDHVSDPDVFVRSMSSRGRLGGVGDATAGLATVMEAVGFDPVVVETVGVGQAEVDVVDHTDTVVVVVTPGWGDAVQSDKAGLLEIGDVFVINKADRPEVDDTRRWLKGTIEMGEEASGWVPPIIETVATQEQGVDELADAIDRHRRHLRSTPEGRLRTHRRARAYLEWALAADLRNRIHEPVLDDLVDQVASRSLDPWSAAASVLKGI